MTQILLFFPIFPTLYKSMCYSYLTFHPNKWYQSGLSPFSRIEVRDPLSPYFFLFCAEGLSFAIRKADLRGITVTRYSPIVTHLLQMILFYSRKYLKKKLSRLSTFSMNTLRSVGNPLIQGSLLLCLARTPFLI